MGLTTALLLQVIRVEERMAANAKRNERICEKIKEIFVKDTNLRSNKIRWILVLSEFAVCTAKTLGNFFLSAIFLLLTALL